MERWWHSALKSRWFVFNFFNHLWMLWCECISVCCLSRQGREQRVLYCNHWISSHLGQSRVHQDYSQESAFSIDPCLLLSNSETLICITGEEKKKKDWAWPSSDTQRFMLSPSNCYQCHFSLLALLALLALRVAHITYTMSMWYDFAMKEIWLLQGAIIAPPY